MNQLLRALCLLVVCVGTAMASASAAPAARTPVIVVADPWEPLMQLDGQGMPAGPIVDFLRRMNVVQSRFDFQISVLPRRRVDQQFMDGQADVFPLRTTAWTAPALNLLATRTIAVSRDVYFARKDNGVGGAAIFNDLPRRIIVGVAGYHYGIFDNNADATAIRARFRELITEVYRA